MLSARKSVPSLALDAAAIAVILFGALTIRSGGSVVIGGAATGAVVPLVVWFNFLAGFAYAAAGIGLWLRQRWGAWLAVGLAIATLVVFGFFGWHVATGGAFEARTGWAMALRSIVWLAVAGLACWTLGCGSRRAR